jgi:hypothetical protein
MAILMTREKAPRLLSAILAFLFLVLPITSAGAAPSPDRIIDVVSITWPNAKSGSIGVQDVAEAIRTTVAPNWRDFTSTQGSPTNSTINFVTGIVSAEPIALTRAMACEGTSSLTLMSSVQREFYRMQKISDYENRYLLILTPDAGCIWQGKAILGDSSSKGGLIALHNTASGFVITHELGHTFGLGHSNLMSCANNFSDGVWVRSCRAIEYGGTIDVMGNVETTSPLSTYHQWRMGLISNNLIHQSWLNESVTLSASDVYGPTRAIFIRDASATYWIEYRRGFGQYKPGLAIYRTDPPPVSAIESPNPADVLASDFTSSVSADLWMLNWDDYKYSVRPTGATGSMTLPVGKTATVFSGNISISARATLDPTTVTVTINRKADRTAPPTPAFSNPNTWRSGDTDILIKGRDDGETAIDYFDLKVDGAISKANNSAPPDWVPTFLNPLTPTPTIFVRDLPEGGYDLSIRSIDVWGNTSDWSTTQKVTIDRTAPKVTGDFTIRKVEREGLALGWTGAIDKESGLCDSTLANPDGWITHRSTSKQSPTFSFPYSLSATFDTSVFDCGGNGVTGTLEIQTRSLTLTDAVSRSGRWSLAKDGSLKCSGRCSISFLIAHTLAVNLSAGNADLLISSKSRVKISPSSLGIVEIGTKQKVVRIQGSEYTISSISSLRFATSEFTSAKRSAISTDPSLLAPEQQGLNKYGFRASDFADGWTVLPMSRGTTLLDPTLDFCAASYPSESDRLHRRQVIATKVGSPYEFLSTEVVRYANATAASNALAELKAALQNCLQNKGGTSQSGLFTPYTFYQLPTVPEGLVSQGQRVIIRATFGPESAPKQLLAIYQYKGAIFTGLYVITTSTTAMSDEVVVRWLDVARVLAARL